LEDYVVHLAKNQNQATVDQLAELIRQKYPLPQEEIVRLLAKLESEGKIRLNEKEGQVPMTTVRFLFSRGASWYWVTILLSLATAVAAFVVPEDAYPIVYVRYVLGSVFVLFLPGYSLIRAVFPSKVEIDIVERAAFSLGLSIALVPVVVLILSFSPLGIGLAPIILSLLPLTIAFATVAVVREHQIRAKEAQSPSQTRSQ
jgi:uncharacterized membrane protein